jgi:hypothetical protein
MGYFKELAIENEGLFYDYVEENGILVDGIMYYDAEVLALDKQKHIIQH